MLHLPHLHHHTTVPPAHATADLSKHRDTAQNTKTRTLLKDRRRKRERARHRAGKRREAGKRRRVGEEEEEGAPRGIEALGNCRRRAVYTKIPPQRISVP